MDQSYLGTLQDAVIDRDWTPVGRDVPENVTKNSVKEFHDSQPVRDSYFLIIYFHIITTKPIKKQYFIFRYLELTLLGKFWPKTLKSKRVKFLLNFKLLETKQA